MFKENQVESVVLYSALLAPDTPWPTLYTPLPSLRTHNHDVCMNLLDILFHGHWELSPFGSYCSFFSSGKGFHKTWKKVSVISGTGVRLSWHIAVHASQWCSVGLRSGLCAAHWSSSAPSSSNNVFMATNLPSFNWLRCICMLWN